MANLTEIVAIDGQTVFDLPFSFTPGANELFVFWQGQLQYVTINYTEPTSTSVRLTYSAQAGDIYTFRVPAGVFTGFAAPTEFSFAPKIDRPLTAPELIYVGP